jgi:hypothetical protein
MPHELIEHEHRRMSARAGWAATSTTRPPLSTSPPGDEQSISEVIDLDCVRRRDLLGGLIHEHQLAA